MKEAIVSLIEISPFLIVAAGFFFYEPIVAWARNRNERLLREQKHLHAMKTLKAKQDHELALAEKLQDPIQMLALDPKFGENFDQRLRIALSKKEINSPVETTEEEIEYEEIKKPKPRVRRR